MEIIKSQIRIVVDKVLKAFLLITALATYTDIKSQDFNVTSFQRLDSDLDARMNYARKDQNGKTCAIIKIDTPLTGLSFDTGTLAVQYVVEKTGQVWVYVMPGVRKITIAHQNSGVLRDWEFPIKIEEATSYQMTLSTDKKDDTSLHSINPKLKRDLLFKLRATEFLETGESNVGFDGTGQHFVAITIDTLLKQKYIIHDGIRKLNAKRLDVLYLNPCDFESSIYFYDDGEFLYAVWEQEKFKHSNVFEGRIWCGWWYFGGDDDPGWAKKGRYSIFRRNGLESWTDEYFKGKVLTTNTKLEPYNFRSSKRTDIYPDTVMTYSGTNMAIAPTFNTLKIKGKTYTLGNIKDFSGSWDRRLVIYENGLCVVEYKERIENPTEPNIIYIIRNGVLRKLQSGESFNYRLGEVQSSDKLNLNGKFTQMEYHEWGYEYYKKKLRVLHDKSGSHTLEACGLYDFVYIDDRQFGKTPAINVWYDDELNEFRWTALEGKELVLYTYKL